MKDATTTDLFCLDPAYSTTRLVTQKTPVTDKPSDVKFQSMQFLPLNPERKGEGGLRTRGYFKQSLPDKPLITVITVVFNGVAYLEDTIKSVINQTYDNVEYIIIDGGSTDGSVGIIKKYEGLIDYWVSEKDSGIYDAMNKGIVLATHEWLSFINAGDCYNSSNSIFNIQGLFYKDSVKAIYSNVVLHNKKLNSYSEYNCDHKRKILIHQALIYKKELHSVYGLYLSLPRITVSDYLFMLQLPDAIFIKTSEPLTIYDDDGVSNSSFAVDQKVITDYLFGRISKTRLVMYLILYHYKIKWLGRQIKK